MIKKVLVSLAALALGASVYVANTQQRVLAMGVSRCARLSAERKTQAAELASNASSLKYFKARIAEMNTTDSAVIDARLGSALDILAAWKDKVRRAPPNEEAADKKWERLAQIQVDFWRARQTEIFSSGAVKSNDGAAFEEYMASNEQRRQSSVNYLKSHIAMLDREIAACAAAHAKMTAKFAPWTGNYVEVADVITVTGGPGGISFREERNTDTVWHRAGTCSVEGSKATCTYEAHYHDSEKDVEYTGHGTLTLYGDSITYEFTQTTGTLTYADGSSCAHIDQCTGLHPGAVATGTWTRKR